MRAVITGTWHGLGERLANELAKAGMDIIGWNRPLEDVSNPIRIAEAAAKIDKVDILVNNAAINELRWIENMSVFDLRNSMQTNVEGIFNCTKSLLPKLAGGTVLNITSAAARIPMTCSLSYNTSKAAAEMMTRQMARELYPKQKTVVFGVAPSKIADTAMTRYIDKTVPKMRGWTEQEAKNYSLANTSTGRDIPLETISEFITWLLVKKERHEYLNGCILPYGI